MERAAKFQRSDSPAARWDKLANVLPAGASLEDKALVADLLSIPSSAPDLLKSMTPQRRKAMSFAVIVRQIENLARQTPTLATLEDMHWADDLLLDAAELAKIGHLLADKGQCIFYGPPGTGKTALAHVIAQQTRCRFRPRTVRRRKGSSRRWR